MSVSSYLKDKFLRTNFLIPSKYILPMRTLLTIYYNNLNQINSIKFLYFTKSFLYSLKTITWFVSWGYLHLFLTEHHINPGHRTI